MSVIRGLVADAGVQPVVIVVVKLLGDAGLGVGQVRKNGPLADLQDLRFEARPQALGLRIIITVAAPALRAHRLVVVQQLPLRVAAVLPVAVRVDEQSRRRRLRPERSL